MNSTNVQNAQLINLFENGTLRSYRTMDISVNDSETQKDSIKTFILKNTSSSPLGRYSISLCFDHRLLEILHEKDKIKLNGYGDGDKEYLRSLFKDKLVDNRTKFLEYLDDSFRQGIRDSLISAGFCTPPEIEEILSETCSTNLAFIPDSGVINRAVLSRQILNRLSIFGTGRFFVAIPRFCLWELENMASASKEAFRKRRGFRGLQEIESLKKYPSQIFDIEIPAPYIFPSKEGSRLSSDALIRFQVRQYARAFSSLIDTCFVTCDKTSYAIAKLEGIKSYCLSIGDLFTVPPQLKLPNWNGLFANMYIPQAVLIHELAIQYGSVKISGEENLEIWINIDFPNKKADDWIRGTMQVELKSGDIDAMKKDLQSLPQNVEKVREYESFW